MKSGTRGDFSGIMADILPAWPYQGVFFVLSQMPKGFGFSGGWTVTDQSDLLSRFFGLQRANKV